MSVRHVYVGPQVGQTPGIGGTGSYTPRSVGAGDCTESSARATHTLTTVPSSFHQGPLPPGNL